VTPFDASGLPSLWRGSLQTGHEDSSGFQPSPMQLPGRRQLRRDTLGEQPDCAQRESSTAKDGDAQQSSEMSSGSRSLSRNNVQILKTPHGSLIAVTWKVPSVSL
jgi:hypothetical protein